MYTCVPLSPSSITWYRITYLVMYPATLTLGRCVGLAKFRLSSLCRYRDIEGSQNSKSRSRDSVATPFDLILHFYDCSLVVNLCAKFEVSTFNRFRENKIPKILKVGHATATCSKANERAMGSNLSMTPFTLPFSIAHLQTLCT